MIEILNYFFSAIRETKHAISLDVADLTYLYLPHNIKYQVNLKSGVPRKGIGVRIAAFFWHMIKSLWQSPRKVSVNSQHQPFFFAVTNNQERVLRPLAQKFDKSYFFGINGFGNEQLPLFWVYLTALPFFPLVFIKFLKARGLGKKAFHYVFDAYWLSYGLFIFMIWLLRKIQPSVVILSNDHLVWTRTLMKAAREEKIKTVYLQHASVTERFPPLTVDFALLEGDNAAEKYASRGASKTSVFLIGTPHFDKYFTKVNKRSKVQKIGICVGMLDELQSVIILGKALNDAIFNKNIFLRSHPGDARATEWQQTAAQLGWAYSDGKTEDAFQFLASMDVILAGDSNILLEAALMNVVPIYYDFMKNHLDWYGFLKNGLVVYHADPLSVAECIKEIDRGSRTYNFRTKAKTFCATVETIYEGRSSELATNLIYQIAQEAIDYRLWLSQKLASGIIVNRLNLALQNSSG
ncbi:MAG: hypothetical protein H6657_23790 [Ardenticatenaceae bacterium]|nr:hypothetical protein [Ardenticatenaceae bacterium]